MAFYLKCKMCGGNVEIQEGTTVAKCKYCGSLMTLPKIDSDKKARLFNNANEYRLHNEFDKSYDTYKSITEENPEEAEAYWGMILSEYGIEYVEDPKTGKRIPTCHRVHNQFIQNSPNYKFAIKYADAERKMMYEEEAEKLDDLQKEILSISSRELPYDVFISYKETNDTTGERTEASVLAHEIYTELTRAGIRTFFSRITLEEHLGENYEPYIYAALRSAKVMLVVTADKNELNAVWVKNEWMRFLHFMQEDKSKSIIPVDKTITAYELPTLLSAYQASDMSKIGAVQDLVHGVERILGQKEITEKDKLLNKVIEDQKKKIEDEQRKAEEKHKKEQEKKANWEKNKKRYFAGGIIIALLAVAAVIFNYVNNTYLMPKKQYAAAVETLNNATLENGGFDTARAEFNKLGDYQDSKMMISKAYSMQAMAALEKGDLFAAKKYKDKITDESSKKDLTIQISQKYLEQAEAVISAGDYKKAIRYLDSIEDESLKKELSYQIALQDIDSNELLSAITRLKDLNYKDSEKKMEECFEKYYKEAEEYYDEGNKKEALNHFSVLANYKYKDSETRVAELRGTEEKKKEKKEAAKEAITGTWTLNGGTLMIKSDGFTWEYFENQDDWSRSRGSEWNGWLSYDEDTDSFILDHPYIDITYQAEIDGDQMHLSVLSDEGAGVGNSFAGDYIKTSN